MSRRGMRLIYSGKSTRLVYRWYTCKCLFGEREKVRVCCAVCIWDVCVKLSAILS